ncbi:MAG: hypothetical protein U0229_21180 [Anaeromyxobacter sp.]
MLERDLILKMVQDLARVLARALGLRKQGMTEQAVQEVETAASSLIGLDLKVVAALDAGVIAKQLVASEKIDAIAQVVWARADLAHDQGDLGEALWRRKAVELWLEGAAAGATLSDDALRAILGHPAADLGARQQRLREALVG